MGIYFISRHQATAVVHISTVFFPIQNYQTYANLSFI